MRIMLVEDNSRMRDIIREIVIGEVKNVDTILECEDGQDAVQRYEDYRPDWVLMDIEMDRMDGIAASKEILRRFPQAKIMIVTQYDDSVYRETARKLGVRAYILKEDLMDIPEFLQSTLDQS